MDSDLNQGRKTKHLHPVNDLRLPKVPAFSSLESAPQTTPTPEPPTNVPQPPIITPPKKKQHRFFSLSWPHSKKKTLIMFAGVVVLLLAASGVAWANQPRGKIVEVAQKKPVFVKKVEPVYGSLSGSLADLSVNQRPVTGVMIENSEEARPQSGMDQAGIVFEAIAEGGITRFLTLYQENEPDYIGPVRSVRPYYLQWCMSFDCAIAHVGGSPEALGDIGTWGVKDLDQFYNAGAYWRIDSNYAPHNVYTSTAKLRQLETSKGFGTPSFTPFERKADAPSATPNAASIDIRISSALFNSHYDWDKTTNSYKRSQAGGPHTVVSSDGVETQLQPKVVVALIMSYGIQSDGKHSDYSAVGSGEAYIFQDGVVTRGTWHKDDNKASIRLTDETNKTIQLNAGQRWFVALPGADKISYQ